MHQMTYSPQRWKKGKPVPSVDALSISMAAPADLAASVQITAEDSIGGCIVPSRRETQIFSSPASADTVGSHLKSTGKMTGNTAAGIII